MGVVRLAAVLPGVVGTEPVEPLLVPQASSTGVSMPGISLPLRRTLLKNFSAVLRSLKVISAEVGVVWMSVNSPMPCSTCQYLLNTHWKHRIPGHLRETYEKVLPQSLILIGRSEIYTSENHFLRPVINRVCSIGSMKVNTTPE